MSSEKKSCDFKNSKTGDLLRYGQVQDRFYYQTYYDRNKNNPNVFGVNSCDILKCPIGFDRLETSTTTDLPVDFPSKHYCQMNVPTLVKNLDTANKQWQGTCKCEEKKW